MTTQQEMEQIIEATDDGSGVQLANGLRANIVHSGEDFAKEYGVL